MKTLQQYINEQLVLEKGHIANKEEIERIAKDITDFCMNDYGGLSADTAYDFKRGSFFYDRLKFLKVKFRHYKLFTASIAVYSPSFDLLLDLDKFEKDYEISGYKAKYFVLELNIDKLPDPSDKKGVALLYGTIGHELTHLYQALNNTKYGTKSYKFDTYLDDLAYLLDNEEMEARINQTYHLIKKKYDTDYAKTKKALDAFGFGENDFVRTLAKNNPEIDKATQISVTQKLIDAVGTDKQKKAFEKYKKKIYRVVYDAIQELNDKLKDEK